MEILYRWLQEHDMGATSVAFDILESHRSFLGAEDVLLRARTVGQDRRAEERARREGIDEIKGDKEIKGVIGSSSLRS